MNANKTQSQRGIALYITTFLMVLALGIGLGVGSVVVKQWNATKTLGDAVAAYYAAETGIEQVLYEGRSGQGAAPLRSNLVSKGKNATVLKNSASSEVSIIDPGVSCKGKYYCILSRGMFEETNRAIRISR